MTIKKLLCLTTISVVHTTLLQSAVADFRLPNKLFVTDEKKALLNKKEYSYFMPKDEAQSILFIIDQNKKFHVGEKAEEEANQIYQDGFTKFNYQAILKNKYGTDDYKKLTKEAFDLLDNILDNVTFHKARKDFEFIDKQGKEKHFLAELRAEHVENTFDSWWAMTKGQKKWQNRRDRLIYWLIYEKENLMHKDQALSLLGVTNDQLGQEQNTRNVVESAYKKKTSNLAPADKKFDDYDRARRTLRALSIPNRETAVKYLNEIKNVEIGAQVTENNFATQLKVLDDIIKEYLANPSSFTSIGGKNAMEFVALAHDRILYDMLEQINYWKKPALPIEPTTPTTAQDLPAKLKNLTNSLDVLNNALKK